ncbi:hypothetical protein [Saccharopolyspora sp. NPDC002376]
MTRSGCGSTRPENMRSTPDPDAYEAILEAEDHDRDQLDAQ